MRTSRFSFAAGAVPVFRRGLPGGGKYKFDRADTSRACGEGLLCWRSSVCSLSSWHTSKQMSRNTSMVPLTPGCVTTIYETTHKSVYAFLVVPHRNFKRGRSGALNDEITVKRSLDMAFC